MKTLTYRHDGESNNYEGKLVLVERDVSEYKVIE